MSRESKRQKLETNSGEEQESSEITQEEQHSSSSSSRELVPARGGVPIKTSTEYDNYSHHRLIFAALDGQSGDLKFKECDLYSALRSLKPEVTDLDHPIKGKRHTSIEIVGSCNGLICAVVDGEEIFLWNPCTRRSKRLPNFGLKSMTDRTPDSHIMSYGFGYDATNDDHKVVGISCCVFAGGRHHTVAKIYSVRTNSWQYIYKFRDCIREKWCYFVNGKLHWTAARLPNEQVGRDAGQKILTLDLANELCEVIEQPDYGGPIFYWTLGTLGGCLSLSACCIRGDVDIWVMKEYGVKNSWTKLFTVPHNLPQNLGGGAFMKPVFGSKDGRFAFLYHADCNLKKQILALFSPKKDLRAELEISNLKNLDGVEVYVRSSVSPDVPRGVRKTRPSNFPIKTSTEYDNYFHHKGVSPIILSEVPIKTSTEYDDYINHMLIFATLDGRSGELKFKECDLYSALHSPKPEVTDLDHPITGTRHISIEIVGSCNGLICVVVDDREIFLWNPCTGRSKTLPVFGLKSMTERTPDSRIMSYGFGYDATNDDYKVVGISCGVFARGGHYSVAKIYSVKTNLWKWMYQFQELIRDKWCCFLNGKLHWTAARRPNEEGGRDAGQKILTLDLANEMCEVIEQPDYGGPIFYWTLGTLGGCLSLSACCRKGDMDIWVMKEYGVKNSWTKLFTVPHNFPENPGGGAFMKPVFGSKNGRFAFLYHAENKLQKQILALCSPKNDLRAELEINNLKNLDGVEVYVKSSVSPDVPRGVQKTRPSN